MACAYAEMFRPRPFCLTTFPNDAGDDEPALHGQLRSDAASRAEFFALIAAQEKAHP
jgi:hypothetical protein